MSMEVIKDLCVDRGLHIECVYTVHNIVFNNMSYKPVLVLVPTLLSVMQATITPVFSELV